MKKRVFGACTQMLAEGFISEKNTFFSFLWEKVVKSKVLYLSFCSNIDSKSSNNLCFLFFFPFVMGTDLKIKKRLIISENGMQSTWLQVKTHNTSDHTSSTWHMGLSPIPEYQSIVCYSIHFVFYFHHHAKMFNNKT